jgi:FSR family fosmidomycin resistance protein-like MFS transporter
MIPAKTNIARQDFKLPAIYGGIHALVDCACAMVVFSAILRHKLVPVDSFNMIVTYNLIAFAGQAPLGLFTDTIKSPRGSAIAGLLLIIGSLLASGSGPMAAAVLAGTGNALFHVGGGAITLNVRPGRASWPGLFVGPGAMGLAAGIILGRDGVFLLLPFLVLLSASILVIIRLPSPVMPYTEPREKPNLRFPVIIVLLLLVSVAVRSIGGLIGGSYCEKTRFLSIAIAIAAFAGKAAGGFISDRIGWVRTSLAALIISAPLIAYGFRVPALVITGMFFFQMTMPVTLTAVALVMPNKPGFAFGLACLALILGAYPTFYDFVKPYSSPHLVLVLILFSVLSVYLGLKMLKQGNFSSNI